MLTQKTPTHSHTAFERLHSIHKIIICLVLAVSVYLLTQHYKIDGLTHLMIGWNTFSLAMIAMSWISFNIVTPTEIRNQSGLQDTSRLVIFVLVLISTIASFLAVLLLFVSKNSGREKLDVIIAITGMLFSWFLVHTIFAMRYAHIYYGDHDENPEVHAGGLIFPGGESPSYLDFAYFSFVLGMTFQVSDVQVATQRLRKLALFHGILSFGFNTVIVALTINVIAGLSK